MKGKTESLQISIDVTQEEKKWVKMLADGMTAQEISGELDINQNTFSGNINLMRIRLGCKNTTNLVALFLRNKLIE